MKGKILFTTIAFLFLLSCAIYYALTSHGQHEVQAQAVGAYDRALQLSQTGQDEEALAELDRALETTPNSVEVLNLKGQLLLKIGRPSEAGEAFQRAIEADASSAFAYMGLAVVQRLEAKDNKDWEAYEEVIKLLQEAIKLDPSSAAAYSELGFAYRDLGKVPEAIEALEKALELDPGRERPMGVLGMLKESR